MKKFRNRRNVKGQVFVIAVIVLVTSALIASYVLLRFMTDSKSPNEFLGSYQSSMIDALADADKTMIYTHQAAKMAISEGLDDYLYAGIGPDDPGDSGNEYESKYCGQYVYRLWNSASKDCYPEYSDLDEYINVRMAKSTYANPELDAGDYFDNILKQNVKYQYSYEPGIGGTTVVGHTTDKYIIPLLRDDEVRSDGSVQEYIGQKIDAIGGEGDIKDVPMYGVAGGNYRETSNRKIEYLVIHYTAGYSIKDAKARFQTPGSKASAHYIVGRTNDNYNVVQMVLEKDVAYHAGCDNDKYGCTDEEYKTINSDSIGIEVVNSGYLCDSVGSCKKDATSVCDDKYMVDGVDKLGTKKVTCWQGYPDKQYEKLVALSASIAKRNNITIDREHIIGHVEVVSKNKVDPGRAFDMDKFVNDVKEAAKLDDETLRAKIIYGNKIGCLQKGNDNWNMLNPKVSQEELTSDKVATISVDIDNYGDTCINILPKVTIKKGDEEIFTYTGDTINIYKGTSSKKFTTIDAVSCTFTTEPGLAKARQMENECVLESPSDGSKITYTASIEVMTNGDKNEKLEFQTQTATFSVSKGATNSYNTQAKDAEAEEALNSPTITLTANEQAKVDSTRKNLEDLGIMEYIAERSEMAGVPKEIIYGLVTQESGGNIDAVSSTGAQGLFQVIRSYHEKRIIKECGSWEAFKTDAKCQVRVGIGILEEYHKQYGVKGLNYRCSCAANKGTTGCKDIDTRYVDWEAAVRAYNSAGCSEWADYNFVNTIMRYAAGWGYSAATIETIKNEAYEGVYGLHTIQPSFEVKMDFDMSLFDLLTGFSKDASKECGASKDVPACVNDKINAFNSQNIQKYKDEGVNIRLTTDCDGTDDEKAVHAFAEGVSDCANSKDDDCSCVIENGDAENKNIMLYAASDEYQTTISFIDTASMSKGKDTHLGLKIFNPDNKALAGKEISLADIRLYRYDGAIYLGEKYPNSCTPNNNMYRMCLKTSYKNKIYDGSRLSTEDIVVPFAITVRDNVPPAPITGLTASNMEHAKNGIILQWAKSPENDVVKYNIYYSDRQSDFDKSVSDYKSAMGYITISGIENNYYEYKDITFSDPGCDQKESDGAAYCTFRYKAVNKEGKEESIVLKPGRLYYLSESGKFAYILDGTDAIYSLSDGKDKFIAVTALDVENNEISNMNEEGKVTFGQNLIKATPVDRLEPGFATIIGAVESADGNTLSLSWDYPGIYIDGTPISTDAMSNIRYDVHISQLPSCIDGMQYPLADFGQSAATYSGYSGQGANMLDVQSYTPGTYCVAVSAANQNGYAYENIFGKSVSISPNRINIPPGS